MSLIFSDNHTNERGFTLVETLVALFILTMGLVPILVVGFSSRRIAETVESNVIAANLAQEGIEVVRALRDTNWVASTSFDVGLAGGDYEVTWDSTAVTPYAGRYLTISPTGIYGYGAGTTTVFQRKVSLSAPSAPEIKVITTIMWSERGTSKSFELEDHLFDWH